MRVTFPINFPLRHQCKDYSIKRKSVAYIFDSRNQTNYKTKSFSDPNSKYPGFITYNIFLEKENVGLCDQIVVNHVEPDKIDGYF